MTDLIFWKQKMGLSLVHAFSKWSQLLDYVQFFSFFIFPIANLKNFSSCNVIQEIITLALQCNLTEYDTIQFFKRILITQWTFLCDKLSTQFLKKRMNTLEIDISLLQVMLEFQHQFQCTKILKYFSCTKAQVHKFND